MNERNKEGIGGLGRDALSEEEQRQKVPAQGELSLSGGHCSDAERFALPIACFPEIDSLFDM